MCPSLPLLQTPYFPTRLLVGVGAAARTPEMTPAADEAAWRREVAFLTLGVVQRPAARN